MNIGIIGSGNVAYHLSRGLYKAGHHIEFIHSRNHKTGKQLATKFDSTFVTAISDIPITDVILICVTDDQIQHVAEVIPDSDSRIVLHCSGAIPSTVLSTHTKYGILYPLYSFANRRNISLKKVPMLLTASDNEVISTLRTLALDISWKTYQVSDQDRALLHVAAVFANNFTNFMMTQAFDIMDKNKLNIDILKPIIQQSTHNWTRGVAKEKQTGPAIRNDFRTMDKHIDLISNSDMKKLYQLISENIIKYHQ